MKKVCVCEGGSTALGWWVSLRSIYKFQTAVGEQRVNIFQFE